jgi:UDP-N-acetylmuramyl pentapeptide phosphotransferase/UDP-N-acetylglucosamine-1-phosphate transferase
MDALATLAGTFVVAALASAALTGLWIRLARARRIVDMPGQRRLHLSATPRGGGIGIGLVMIVTCVLMPPGTPGPASWPGLAAAIAVFSAIGLVDDLRPMPAWLKLLLQLTAAAFMLTVLGQPATIVWLLGLILVAAYFINAWNFMDGSNGMVAGQSLLIAVAVAVWPGVPLPTRFAALALAGACAGFLPFNLPRAQVFLGDVGSHALGASVFALLWLAWKQDALSLPQVLLLSSAMLLDSGLTLLRRALGGRKVWHAHREHLYQYAVRSGHSHIRVCLAYATWTTIAAGVACLTGAWRSSSQAWLFLFIFLMIGGLVYNGLRGYWLGFGTRRRRTRKHG